MTMASKGRPKWTLIVGILAAFGGISSLTSGEIGPGVLGVVVAAGLILYYFGKGAPSKTTRTASHKDPTARQPASLAPMAQAEQAEHTPATPAGLATSPWSVDKQLTEVAGEAYHQDAIKKVYKSRGVHLDETGAEITDLNAKLALDPTNPYDPNAIAVWISGEHVGYLSRDDSARYVGPLDDLNEDGLHLEVPIRLWARVQTGWDEKLQRAAPNGRLAARVSLVMPPAAGVQSFNALPAEPHTVIPEGSTIQVTREEDHMEALSRYLADQTRYIAVTLHLVHEAKTERSATHEVVEVRLDGQRVGVLTTQMSEQTRDLVAHIAGRGRLPVCRAVLKGSPLRAEVTLKMAKSAQVTGAWLEGIPLASG